MINIGDDFCKSVKTILCDRVDGFMSTKWDMLHDSKENKRLNAGN